MGTKDSGLFRFFDPDNWEVLIKVLDGCAVTPSRLESSQVAEATATYGERRSVNVPPAWSRLPDAPIRPPAGSA